MSLARNAAYHPQTLNRINSFASAKFSFEKQLMDLDEQDSAYAEVKQKYFESKEKLEHFILGLEKKYPSYYHYKYDTASPSLDVFRREVLHDDVSLVSYFTTSLVGVCVSGHPRRYSI